MEYTKTTAAIFSICFLLAVLFPVKENWSPRPKDNFPNSYYPMFSKKRGDSYTVNYFIGLDASNNAYILPYNFAGTGGFNQVRRQINRAVRNGDGKKLVKKVARRVARKRGSPYNQIVKVQLIRGTFNFDAFFLHDDLNPESSRVIASKKVNRK